MEYIKNPTEKQKKEWKEKARQNEKEAYRMIRDVAENYKTNAENIAEYFEFATRFYQYSPKNSMLIYSQNENATFVQSFLEWKKMNASVKKGEVGIKILVPQPVTFLKINDNDYVQLSKATQEQKRLCKEGKIESFQRMSFGIGNVFDISQTTFPKERYPEIFNMGYSSEKHQDITNGLINFSRKEINCPVTYEDVKSIALLGYYLPGEHRIVLNHLMEDTVQLSTMSHELGHALAHHEINGRSKAQVEFEGDAISIMIQKNYGIDLTEERKSHMAAHFKMFQEECRERINNNHPQLEQLRLEEKVNEEIMNSFSNIFDIYKSNIDNIEKYVNAEVELSKAKQTFLKNGVDEEKLAEWIKDGKLFVNEDSKYTFSNGKEKVNVSLNQFINSTNQTIFIKNEEGKTVFVTQKAMELLKELSYGKSVLLIENDGEIQNGIKLLKENGFENVEFGFVNEKVRKEVKREVGLTENIMIRGAERDVQMEI